VVAAPTSTPYLPEWFFCTSTIGISPVAGHRFWFGVVVRVRVGAVRGRSDVGLCDSDAIRVRFRA
jgi:hypothetical protein